MTEGPILSGGTGLWLVAKPSSVVDFLVHTRLVNRRRSCQLVTSTCLCRRPYQPFTNYGPPRQSPVGGPASALEASLILKL